MRPDVVFPRQRVALFVDGCSWHGCPEHGTSAATNASYWEAKIAENRARNRRHTELLESDGWSVIRAWEHDDPAEVVERATRAVRGWHVLRDDNTIESTS